jgi:hypothetical protein
VLDSSLTASSFPRTTRWAVLTIVLGAVLTFWLVWAVLHHYPDLNTPNQLGGAIGGIAGPILSFVALLVVYFSLREQYNANQLQIQHFRQEQQRSANESTIATAFKIIDDLRAEARRLTTDSALLSLYPSEHLPYINIQRYPDFGDVNYLQPLRLLDYRLTLDEATAPSTYPYTDQRSITAYFTMLEQETHVLRATYAMLLYLLDRSQLPVSQRLHFYTLLQAVYEPLVMSLLNGLEVFRPDESSIDELVDNIWNLRERLTNGREAYLDMADHEPNQQH